MQQVRQGAPYGGKEAGPPEEVQACGPRRLGTVAGMREDLQID